MVFSALSFCLGFDDEFQATSFLIYCKAWILSLIIQTTVPEIPRNYLWRQERIILDFVGQQLRCHTEGMFLTPFLSRIDLVLWAS